ncbi:hypothetical protein VSA01S_17780 [Vibrio sagamiensis NBRC 104589]|uniref:Uncharacterized protein n=1 Tax=Vibrio sagamiensis NBRC 104589 TaxID=1219064 RepID=A0A511QER1_9VIBR|nr:hypothetical protein VSA01S_17780 [Vibrio sagamiensis NBRC 104589]
MKNQLLYQHVKPEHIVTNSRGDNTHLTSQNLSEHFNATKSLVTISQHYHICMDEV